MIQHTKDFCFKLFQKVYWVQDESLRDGYIYSLSMKTTDSFVYVLIENCNQQCSFQVTKDGWEKKDGYLLFSTKEEGKAYLKLCLERNLRGYLREANSLQERLNKL